MIVLPQGLRVAIVFALLMALMLTGMPVSIALGLTVLSFMFTLTDVRTEVGRAEAVHRASRIFEIMAIPFFILAGNFLTHGGVARRMIDFATSMVGHWHGGLGARRRARLRAVRRGVRLVAGDGGGDRLGDPAGDGRAGLSQAVRRRRDHDLGLARHPHSAVDPDGAVRGLDQRLGRQAVHRRHRAGHRAGDHAWQRPPGIGHGATIIRACRRRRSRERFDAFRKSIWGLLLIVIVIGGIYSGLFTPTEAAAMSAVYAFVVAVFVYKDLKLSDVPRVLLSSANLSAMLLYIITNAVLFSFLMTLREHPACAGAVDDRSGASAGSASCCWSIVLLLLAGNVMEPSSIILIMAPILFPVAMKLGIDPIHFGILMTVNMEVGLCHPPVGLNLYVASVSPRWASPSSRSRSGPGC